MSSVSVVSATPFRNGSPHGKVHILQESINNLANTNNVNKSDKREIIILRKKTKFLPATLKPAPQTISVTSLINSQNAVLIQNTSLISGKIKKTPKPKETTTKPTNPPPIAVARRNARERNRVKQVNNGFATLRQHIPNEIAEIYENAHNKSANKKLSKVETLRMAVDYIRSLERLLDDKRDTKENNSIISLASFPSPASSESLQNNSSFEQSYLLQSPLSEDDEDSNPPTPLPSVINHHYSRIPGTNTFQLVAGPAPVHQFEDEENIHPLTPNSDLISQEDMLIHHNLIDENMEFIQSTNQQFTVIPPDMISSDFYSDSSLSPHQESDLVDVKYDPAMDMDSDQQGLYTNSIVVNTMPLVLSQEQLMNRLPSLISVGNYNIANEILLNNTNIVGEKVIIANDLGLKMEPDDADIKYQENVNEKENNIDDVMSWWQTESNLSQK